MKECFWCEGTGKFKEPKNKDAYDREFNRLDAPGVLPMGQCREKALEYVGYNLIECPYCHGTGIEE